MSKQTKTEARKMTFQDTMHVFEQAISEGRLSNNPTAANYWDLYMYMGTDDSGRDLFKNIETRSYDV